MTEPVPAGEAVLKVIADLRRAARQAVRRPDLTDRERCAVIVELACRARESGWPWAAQTAVWTEVRDFLAELSGEEWMWTPPSYPAIPDDLVERACRSLTARNYVRCPKCRRPLPDKRELERWRTFRAATVDEARRREGAVDA